MRILAVPALLGPGLLVLAASCTPPPQSAPVVAEPAPIPLTAPPVAPPPVPMAVAAAPPPAPPVEFVPVPALWLRMLTKPAPAGRLLLNNFTFVPTRIQAVLASGPSCTIEEGGAVTEFVLPPNGTRVLPAPPGWDICWRRQRIADETARSPPGPWTAWNRAYTGTGRFLDTAVLPPSPRATVTAAMETPPALPPPVAPIPPDLSRGLK